MYSPEQSTMVATMDRRPSIETYATMINKRIILPSQKTNYIAVETHFLVTTLRQRIEEIFVDEDWYVERYPDVQIAIDNNVVINAREHYALHGYYEHRQPYSFRVDETWYLAQYEDIRKAVTAQLFLSGQAHFDEVGFREGRLPFAGFALRAN